MNTPSSPVPEFSASYFPDDDQLPEALQQQVDSDLAARSFFSSPVYGVLWLVLVVFTNYYREFPTMMAVTGGLLGFLVLGRLYLAARFQQLYFPNGKRWRLAFDLGVVFTALTWAILCASLVARHGLDANSLVVLLATAGIAAGACTSLAPRLRLLRTFLLILLLPVILRTAFDEGYSARSITLIAALYLGFLMTLANRIHFEYKVALCRNWRLRLQTKELERQLERALQANNNKEQFLAQMSREMRTSLNAILGFSELLAHGQSGPLSEEQVEYVGHIIDGGKNLLRLINDSVDLSQTAAGQLSLRLEHVDGNSLCETITQMVQPLSQERQHTLQYQAAQPPLYLQADPQRLKQMLAHLLINAIKFTPDGGEICFSLGRDDNGDIRFTIKDSGIGISPDGLRRLFKPFVQLENSASSLYPGNGLGLALCQRLAALHQGRIEVESELGVGSSFCLILPSDENRQTLSAHSPDTNT